MLPTRPAALVRGALATAILVSSAQAQASPARDSAQLVRRLAAATGPARIPLLADLAEFQREIPAAALRTTDEALALLAASPSPAAETRIRTARSAAYELQGNYPDALTEAERAHRLAAAAGVDTVVDVARYLAARALWRSGNYPAAMARAESTFTSQSRRLPSVDLVRTIELIGGIHQAQGDLDQALERSLAALEIAERLGDRLAIADAHNTIAVIYWDLGRHTDALAALHRALPILEKGGGLNSLGNALNNMGLVLTELRRDREAIPYLERALALARTTGNRFAEAKEYSNLGWARYDLKELDQAETFFRKAADLREQIGHKEGVIRSRGALADVALARGDTARAIAILETTIPLARAINDRPDEREQLRELAEAKTSVGDTTGAFIAYRRFLELQAALADTLQQDRTARLDARYRSMTEERDLAEARTAAETRREELRIVIGASLLLGVALLLLGVVATLRVRALRAAAETERRYRVLFQASAVPTFLIDAPTREIIDCNEPARKLWPSGGVTLPIGLDAVEPDWVRRALLRAFEADHGAEIAVEDRWTDGSGRLRWTEVRGGTVTFGGRDCRLVGVRDATEDRLLEEARHREEKLQSLGVLAGGIAHDFNNALTAVLGHVTLARDATPAERTELLEAAEEAAYGARRLTVQLLAFAKGGEPARTVTDLGRLLRDATAMAAAGSHLAVEFDLVPDLWPAEVDRGQLSQVVSNLVINAKQATGEGGRLVVRAENAGGPDGGRSVRIEFTDNGSGIPAEIRDRIFEPYFTTKSGGTGLGLATAFTICRNHGGSLTCESASGHGTTFVITLPASDAVPVEPEPGQLEAPTGGGRILVLDDEPMVRRLIERMLTGWGYTVDATADGRAAVDRYLEAFRRGTPYDLLIMDLTIPGGMGGRQAMAEILKIDPAARAIVASGYSDDPTMAHHREAGFQAAIAKPFRATDLARTVQAVLRSRGDRTEASHRRGMSAEGSS